MLSGVINSVDEKSSTFVAITLLVVMDEGHYHYSDVIMTTMASQITSLTVVYLIMLIVYSDADQRKHQSSARLAFVRGIHRSPVNSPHKGPVTGEMFPFDDVIMMYAVCHVWRMAELVQSKFILHSPASERVSASISVSVSVVWIGTVSGTNIV